MKKRRMMFRKLFLPAAVFAVLSVMYGCKQNVDKQQGDNKFEVKFTNEGEGGKVTAKIKGGKELKNPDTVEKGTTVIFTATPNAGYAVKEWKGVNVTPKNKETTEVAANSNLDVKVFFEKKTDNKVEVKFINGNDGGTVTAKIKGGKELKNPDTVEKGTTVIFTATPNAGYAVKEWKGVNVTPKNKETTEVVANSNLDVKVVFEKKTIDDPNQAYMVSFSNEGDGGKVTARYKDIQGGFGKLENNKLVKKGTVIIFTATPDNDNYIIGKWTGISGVADGQKTAELKITENVNIKVSFIKNKFEIKFTNENDGGTVTAKIKGGEPITSPAIVEKGKEVEFTAKANTGYDVKEWRGITATPATSKTATLTVKGDADIKVVFVKQKPNTHTVRFSNSTDGGKVTAKIKDGGEITNPAAVEAGKTVVFTATPDASYKIGAWSGISGVTDGQQTAELTINGDKNIQVGFIKQTAQITIKGDANTQVTVDAGKDYATIQVGLNSKWSNVKSQAEAKVSVKDSSKYEICLWKIADEENKTGGMLKDDYEFKEDAKIIAITIPKEDFAEACSTEVKIEGKATKTDWTQGTFWKDRKIKLKSYKIAKTEVTYQLWYPVRIWAEANGYEFGNKGAEGGGINGKVGAEPTDKSDHPVTTVHWRDCVVWCNAYTAMKNKNETDCVYKKDNASGEVLKNSAQSFTGFTAFMDKTKTGFRLPTEAEWEYAARYQRDNTNGNAEEYGSGVWLTKLDSASGASNKTKEETIKYAWVGKTSTNPTAKLQPNALGLYDMTGNVYEWCYDFFMWSYDTETPGTDGYVECPTGPNSGYEHTLRSSPYNVDISGIYWPVGFRTKKDDATEVRGFRLASFKN